MAHGLGHGPRPRFCPHPRKDISLLSPGLNKLPPGMKMLALKRQNLPLQDSEPCLKTKRTVMPEVFLFPREICLELLEVEEVNENEEFWRRHTLNVTKL